MKSKGYLKHLWFGLAICLPAAVLSPVSASQGVLDAGRYCSALLRDDGTVWTWGANSSGVLGITTEENSPVPRQLTTLGNTVTWLSAGDSHMLAVKSNGTVWSWGSNSFGALGNGNFDGGYTPGQVTGLTGVSKVAAGSNHSLALKTNGTVVAWGYNTSGQLGDTSTTNRSAPVPVSGLTGIQSIAAGTAHSLAVDGNGDVWAWGSNQYGRLGTGTGLNSSVPVKVNGLDDIVEVATGSDHSIAVDAGGTVFVWGRNQDGQLGTGNTTDRTTPIALALTNIIHVRTGSFHSLAVDANGDVWGWGRNVWGQLGRGNLDASLVPVHLGNFGSDVIDVAGGEFHTLAMTSSGVILGCGGDDSGQLGAGFNRNHTIAEQVVGMNDITSVGAANGFAVATRKDGSVWTWGSNFNGGLGTGGAAGLTRSYPAAIPDFGGAVACDAGVVHAIVAKSDGTVWTWGGNTTGQLGDGTTVNRFAPVQVAGLTTAKKVAAGAGFSVALLADGTVRAWGNNASGELGNNTRTSSNIPVIVSGLNNVKDIQAGWHHTLALKNDGTVWAWGNNGSERLGTGYAGEDGLVPRQVYGFTNIVSIAAGAEHSLAAESSGIVWAWGSNDYGQLGHGISGGEFPEQIPDLGASVVAAGDYHSFAITFEAVNAWGANTGGQLGYENEEEEEDEEWEEDQQNSPVPVMDAQGLTRIISNSYVSMGLKEDGSLLAWGTSNAGLLADGIDTFRMVPAAILGVNRFWLSPAISLQAFEGATVALGSSIRINGALTEAETSIMGVTFNSRGVYLDEVSSSPLAWEFTPTTWGNIEINAIATDDNVSLSKADSIILKVPYDSDYDGFPDWVEIKHFKNLHENLYDDTDGDGRTNEEELAAGTDPVMMDTDGDGIPDGTDSNPLLPNYTPVNISNSLRILTPSRP